MKRADVIAEMSAGVRRFDAAVWKIIAADWRDAWWAIAGFRGARGSAHKRGGEVVDVANALFGEIEAR